MRQLKTDTNMEQLKLVEILKLSDFHGNKSLPCIENK